MILQRDVVLRVQGSRAQGLGLEFTTGTINLRNPSLQILPMLWALETAPTLAYSDPLGGEGRYGWFSSFWTTLRVQGLK